MRRKGLKKGTDGFLGKLLNLMLGDSTLVILTPIAWQPDKAEASGRRWYFHMISGADGSEFFIDKIDQPDSSSDIRDEILTAVTLHSIGKGVVVIDAATELQAAQYCEAAWPCERSRKILAQTKLDEAFQPRRRAVKDDGHG